MSDLVSKAKCKLIICPWVENRNDRWIQVGAGADPGGEWGGPGGLSPAFTWLWEWGLHRFLTGSREARPPGAQDSGRGYASRCLQHPSLSCFPPNALVPDRVLSQAGSQGASPPPLLHPPDLGEDLLPRPAPGLGGSPRNIPRRSLESFRLSSQDEMEFGYVEAPHKSFPVVFDSPRDRGLKEFSYNRILVCGKGQSGKPLGGSCYRTRSVLRVPVL